MIVGWLRAAARALVLVSVGCGAETSAPPRPAQVGGGLPAGVVARVGTAEIRGETVARIAAVQGVSLEIACDRAVRDALFAEEAKARGIDAEPEVTFAVSAALGRRALRELHNDAWRRGPVTDEELRVMTARHWLELDRPDGYRTVHAVIRLDDKAPETKRKTAAVVAEAVLEAARGLPELGASTTPPPRPRDGSQPTEDALATELRKITTFVPHEAVELVMEVLPPVTAAGRIMSSEGGTFDPIFSAAAAKLTRRGEVSPPITTPFGVHIVVLLERIPGYVMPAEERRALVRAEVMTERALHAKERFLDPLKRDAFERNVDALLALVSVER